jgi:hypothetical protein
MNERTVPPEILQNLKRWAWIGNSLRILQILLGVVGTAAGLYVATFTDVDTQLTKLATYVAALCLGIMSAFNVGGKADSVRRAWRHVTAACMLYRQDPEFPLAQLVRAYQEAEAMVGDVPFHGKAESIPGAGTSSIAQVRNGKHVSSSSG